MIRRWTISLAIALLLMTLAGAAVFAARQNERLESVAAGVEMAPDTSVAQQINGTYRWNFSAKFVCGYQPPVVQTPGVPPLGEPVVKPGNYATEVNIHNYNYREVPVRKKFIYLVAPSADGKDFRIAREPESTGPQAFDQIVLGPDRATMDDCNRFWQMLHPNQPPPDPFPLMIGYLVLISPLDLDVDVVYTAAAPGKVSTESTSVSIDVERVPGKRVFVPAGALP